MSDNPEIKINAFATNLWEINIGGKFGTISKLDIDKLSIENKKILIKSLVDSI